MFHFDIETFNSYSSDEHLIDAYLLQYVNKMKVRRLNNFTKIIIDLAQKTISDKNIDYIIYSSRHGELDYSYNIMLDIINGKSASPAKFSQSVHNSTASFLTILNKLNVPVNAISSGKESFLYGHISALNVLKQNKNAKILYIYADGAIPDFYHNKINEKANNLIFISLIKSGSRFSLERLKSNTIPFEIEAYKKLIMSEFPGDIHLGDNWFLRNNGHL